MNGRCNLSAAIVNNSNNILAGIMRIYVNVCDFIQNASACHNLRNTIKLGTIAEQKREVDFNKLMRDFEFNLRLIRFIRFYISGNICANKLSKH